MNATGAAARERAARSSVSDVLQQALPQLAQTLHHCNLVRNEMWHLTSNLSRLVGW